MKEFIISLDYDNMAETFQDDLYNLVDKLALSVRSAFLTILTGFDGLTNTRDPTPEIALDRSKVASVRELDFSTKLTEILALFETSSRLYGVARSTRNGIRGKTGETCRKIQNYSIG